MSEIQRLRDIIDDLEIELSYVNDLRQLIVNQKERIDELVGMVEDLENEVMELNGLLMEADSRINELVYDIGALEEENAAMDECIQTLSLQLVARR